MDGIPVGISSRAAIWTALQLAQRPENKGRQNVVIVPSSSERYLCSWLFADVGLDTDPIEDIVSTVTLYSGGLRTDAAAKEFRGPRGPRLRAIAPSVY